MKPSRISPASLAERWIGSYRREPLDYVLIHNEAHLIRLSKDYVSYYHTDRTHGGLEKDMPAPRPVAPKQMAAARPAISPVCSHYVDELSAIRTISAA